MKITICFENTLNVDKESGQFMDRVYEFCFRISAGSWENSASAGASSARSSGVALRGGMLRYGTRMGIGERQAQAGYKHGGGYGG